MEPTVSGPSTGLVLSTVLWAEVRHLLELLLWALVLCFATAAGAWCCGYVAREAWLKAGPPTRRPQRVRPPDGPPADEVAREAAQGVLEIERYLADVSAGRGTAAPDRDRSPGDDGPS